MSALSDKTWLRKEGVVDRHLNGEFDRIPADVRADLHVLADIDLAVALDDEMYVERYGLTLGGAA